MSTQPRPERQTRFRRVGRRALQGVAGLLVLIVLLLLVLHLPPVQRGLVRNVLGRLEGRLGLVITFDDLRFNLFTRTVTIRGLTVTPPGAPEPFVSARRVHVSFPLSLYSGDLDGLDVELEETRVALIRDESGWLTMPARWFEDRPDDGGGGGRIPAFQRVSARDLDVRYEDRDAQVLVDTEGLGFDLTRAHTSVGDRIVADLVPGAETAVRIGERGTDITLRGGRATLSPEGASVEHLGLEAPEGDLDANVRFVVGGDPGLTVDVHGDLHAEALDRWVDAMETASGQVALDFVMPSAAGEPAFADVTAASERLTWRGLEMSRLSMSGALASGAIQVRSLGLGVAGGRVQAEGRLAWADEETSQATVSATGLDAGRLVRVLAGDSDGMRRLAPASRVSGRFEGRWTDWRAAALSGALRSSWTRRPSGPESGERWWLDGQLGADFRREAWVVTLEQEINDALGLQGSVTTVASERDFAAWPLDGSLQLQGQTPGSLRTALAVADVTPPLDLAEAFGAMSGRVDLAGQVGAPRAHLTLDADIAWPDQPAAKVSTSATVTTDRVVVEQFHGASGSSELEAAVAIDLDRSRLEGRFEGRSIDIGAWTRRFALGDPVAGTVNLSGTLDGPLRDPTVTAAVTTGPLVAGGQTFDSLSSTVRLEDGVVSAEDLDVAQADGAIRGRVSWDLSDETLAARLALTDVQVGTTVPGLTGSGEGPVELVAPVSGDLSVEGSLEGLIVSGQLSVPALMLGDQSLGPVSIDLTTEGEAAAVDVSAPDLGLVAEGTIGLTDERRFELSARLDTRSSPLDVMAGQVSIDTGVIDVTAQATGTLTDFALEHIDIRLDGLSAEVAGLPLAAEPGGHLEWTPDRVAVEEWVLTSGGARITANGSLNRGGDDSSIDLRAEGRLEDLRPLLVTLGGESGEAAVAEGPFCAVVNLSGPPDAPTVVGSMDLDGVSVGDGTLPPLEGVWARLALDEKQLQINLLEGRWQGAHAAISGTVPAHILRIPGAPSGGVARISGHVDEVTLDVIRPFVEGEALAATDFEARVEFSAEASALELDAIEADLTVSELSLESRDMTLSQREPARIHLANSLVTVDPWTLGTSSMKSSLTVGGTLGLGDTPRIDIEATGELDLAAVGLLVGTYRPAGRATLDVTVAGTLDSPTVDGVVRLVDGELLIRDPRLVFADLDGTLRFANERLTIESMTGTVNGGTLEAGGTMRQPGRGEPDGRLTVTVRGMLLNVPKDVRSSVDADLQLRERRNNRGLQVDGTVTVAEAAYREAMLVTGGLMQLFQSDNRVLPTARAVSDDDEGLPIALDIRVVADDSILIDTTLGKLALSTNLRVRGTVSEPRVTGQATVAPGGELYVGGRTYRVETGLIEFRDPTSLRPDVRLLARTSVGGYDVTMRVETREGLTETTLRSDPPLPEQEIGSLLLYGDRNASGARAGELVTEQLAAALSGEIVGAVGRAIGFDSVRVGQDNPGDTLFDSSLLSSTQNPSQRITFSKRVATDLEVVISQSLRQSGDITWIVSWVPLPYFELRFVQQDNQDRSYEFRYDVSFGGGAPQAQKQSSRPQERVRAVEWEVSGTFSDATLAGELRLHEGDRFDFYKWQRDRDRLIEFLHDREHYEGRVSARRNPSAPPTDRTDTPSPVDIRYEVESGPRTVLSIAGIQVPSDVREALVQTWADVPVDLVLPDEMAARLRPWLARNDYLQPQITVDIRETSEAKVALVHVEPGPKFTDRVLQFSGNDGLSSETLESAVEAAGIGDALWSQPDVVDQVLTGTYRQRGYLTAEVEVGTPRYEGTRAELPITIAEGPLFTAGTVRLVDEAPGEPDQVDTTLPIEPGTVLTDRRVADAVRELRRRYLRAGYRGTRVRADSTAREGSSTVDLAFNVDRGQRAVFGEVRIAGNSNASDELIKRHASLEPGEPVTLPRLGRASDRLYDTGLFRIVNIEPQFRRNRRAGADGGVPDLPDAVDEDADDAPETREIDALITVEELPRYRLRTGFQLFDPVDNTIDTRWGRIDPGVVVDLTRRGLFGKGLVGGVAAQANSAQQIARVYVSSRRFFTLPIQTNAYVSEERYKAAFDQNEFRYRARDFTLDQRVRYRRLLQFNYGYNFRRIRYDLTVLIPGPIQPIPVPIRIEADISRLLGSVVLDGRDDVIDTTKGWFHSSSFEVAPESLGTTLRFTKYLGQAFLFQPLVSDLVAASAARLEVAAGPGRSLIITERLAIGGSTTVRGYVDDSELLQSVTTQGEGTTGIAIFNQEFRFPLFWRLKAATFWDHATLFGDLQDFDGLRVRNGVGGGVRLVLPFLIVRVDYGYPLTQDERNDKGRWYFAIGQAF